MDIACRNGLFVFRDAGFSGAFLFDLVISPGLNEKTLKGSQSSNTPVGNLD